MNTKYSTNVPREERRESSARYTNQAEFYIVSRKKTISSLSVVKISFSNTNVNVNYQISTRFVKK